MYRLDIQVITHSRIIILYSISLVKRTISPRKVSVPFSAVYLQSMWVWKADLTSVPSIIGSEVLKLEENNIFNLKHFYSKRKISYTCTLF
jgi:hypothetical protein